MISESAITCVNAQGTYVMPVIMYKATVPCCVVTLDPNLYTTLFSSPELRFEEYLTIFVLCFSFISSLHTATYSVLAIIESRYSSKDPKLDSSKIIKGYFLEMLLG